MDYVTLATAPRVDPFQASIERLKAQAEGLRYPEGWTVPGGVLPPPPPPQAPPTQSAFDWLGLISGVTGAAAGGVSQYYTQQEQNARDAHAAQLQLMAARGQALQVTQPADYRWLWILLGIAGVGAIALVATRKGKR